MLLMCSHLQAFVPQTLVRFFSLYYGTIFPSTQVIHPGFWQAFLIFSVFLTHRVLFSYKCIAVDNFKSNPPCSAPPKTAHFLKLQE